jgi:hypothetical protein
MQENNHRFKCVRVFFQRLTPNTGIARFSLTVAASSRTEDFVCEALHEADHLGRNGERESPMKIFEEFEVRK